MMTEISFFRNQKDHLSIVLPLNKYKSTSAKYI